MKETTPRPPMVLSYLRFSTVEQAKGDSTRRQLEASERYARERGWEIDKSMSDAGISAFRGSNATTGALGKLLDLVKDKRIPRGSVLLVESLDRLSRNEITEALELFMGLIRAGLRIITLADGREYTKDALDMSSLMFSLMVMSRAHEESATKSKRIGASWQAKRARMNTEPLTGMVPAWLDVKDGKIVADSAKAQIVRRVFDMALEGHGITAIVKSLNREKTAIGWRRDYWQRSYVSKILHNRAVIGEFQPHRLTHRDGKRLREPAGDPIKGYYPAVVSEQDFYAAQAGLKTRKTHTGPSGKFVNLFKGQLFDAQDKAPLQIQTKGTRAYASAAAIDGRSRRASIAFPVAAFETAFVLVISESTDLQLKDTRAAELGRELQAVAGKLQAVAKRISMINAALADTDNDVPAGMIPALSKLNDERMNLAAQSETIQQQLASARMGSPAEAREHVAKLAAGVMTGRMSDATRFELQQAIGQLVERIDCKTSRAGAKTECGVVVTLKNGATVRYAVGVKNRCASEVLVTLADGDTLRAIVTVNGEKPKGIGPQTEERIKAMWQESIRPVLIAKECGVSISQVYRLAGKLPRLKQWKPANRWDII